jgi:hypothetical protein
MSDCYQRWLGFDRAPRFREFQIPREPWQSTLTIWREVAPAGNATVTLETHVSSDTSRVRYARVLAIPASHFVGIAEYAGPIVTASAPEPIEVTALANDDPDPVLAIATMRVETDCPGQPERAARFTIGDAATAYSHVTENCGYEATYGAIALTSGNTLLRAEVAAPKGGSIHATHATLAQLRLR